MQLLFIRHGLAGKPNSSKFPDDDLRPLTSKGKKSFKQALKGLSDILALPKKRFKPHVILTSPALRCLQTAVLVSREFKMDAQKIAPLPYMHHSIPAATALLKLSKQKLPALVVLVGHEPWISELVSLLISGKPEASIDVTKGGAAFLTVKKLKLGNGQLEWLLTQDQLASKA